MQLKPYIYTDFSLNNKCFSFGNLLPVLITQPVSRKNYWHPKSSCVYLEKMPKSILKSFEQKYLNFRLRGKSRAVKSIACCLNSSI